MLVPFTAMPVTIREIDDPETNPPWVLHTKRRMPPHQEPYPQEWFLSDSHMPWQRWLAAEQDMMRERNEGHTMKMSEAFDKIRRDIGLERVCWNPQKWTTMVQGRPVQAQ